MGTCHDKSSEGLCVDTCTGGALNINVIASVIYQA